MRGKHFLLFQWHLRENCPRWHTSHSELLRSWQWSLLLLQSYWTNFLVKRISIYSLKTHNKGTYEDTQNFSRITHEKTFFPTTKKFKLLWTDIATQTHWMVLSETHGYYLFFMFPIGFHTLLFLIPNLTVSRIHFTALLILLISLRN